MLASMRSRSRASRGLAEIVGTLMLVVIVVAAATAFAFFVQAYQKQLQAEETATHNKNLENLRVLALTPDTVVGSTNLLGLQIELASLDVNTIVIEGIVLNGYTLVRYNVTLSPATNAGLRGCLQGSPTTSTDASCTLDLPAEAHVYLGFSFIPGAYYSFINGTVATLTEDSLIALDFSTTLGNVFVQSFVPPVAVAGVTFVDSYPILDGTDSYQPATNGSESVAVDDWSWNVTAPKGSNDTGNYSGQEVELLEPFTPMKQYAISLTVTNSEDLEGSTQIDYELY